MTVEDWMAALPQSLEPEFVMASPDEPIRLAIGTFDLLRDGQLLGYLEGEITLEWTPRLRIICTGESDAAFTEIFDRPLHVRVPQLGLTAEAFVTGVKSGRRHELQASLIGVENLGLQDTQQFCFYLVNFPFILGELVRTGNGPYARAGRNRLRMTAGSLVCTIDRISQTGHLDVSKKPGYLLTHVAEIKKSGQSLTPREVQEILDLLYWLFAFMRGARTGPVLPSLASPFAQHWISVAPWTVDEARRVDTWLPDHSPIDVDCLFAGFMSKWRNPVWNEALKTTLAWYVAANAPSTPSEARIPLCQIALEVLASLQGLEDGPAHKRIRSLLQGLNISTQVPPRLRALDAYATKLGVDAPECLTRIRNKFEHPTAKNRKHAGTVDGITRMQAAQYGIELFELCLLALMNYRGKYARRAFQGWKGDDEIPVPWA